jgi:hypothetical protein
LICTNALPSLQANASTSTDLIEQYKNFKPGLMLGMQQHLIGGGQTLLVSMNQMI